MKLILINGQGGSGKTSTGKNLLANLKDSVFIDADSLVSTNPWEFGSVTDDLAIKNGISLIGNFSHAGFKNIIISGLTRNQQLLDHFLEQLTMKTEIVFVWLKAKKEVRISRKENRDRDGADKKEHFDVVDALYSDIDSIDIKNGKSLFLDTSDKDAEWVVQEIIKYCN